MPYYYKYDPLFVEIRGSFYPNTSVYFDMQLICKAVKKKAPYYYKEDISSMLMDELFSRTFFARFALRLVCSLLCKAKEKKMPYYYKIDSSFASICAWCV